ncbi:MAG: hypothetical protein NDF51_05385 [archaeon YNP-WB-040]|jgi:hypothetical protein|nr:hypothetical protein [Candidatus Culexarchaeum yellowstonense]
MSLSKVTRILRRRTGKGRIGNYGAEQSARDVVGQWKLKRDVEGDRWAGNYRKGISEADTEEMASNLSNWYSILETKVAPKLSEVVKPVYSEVVREYRRAKKPKAVKKIPIPA